MVTARDPVARRAQVEAQNFEIRKNVLKYDDVLNRQRQVIYDERRQVLEGADLHEQVRAHRSTTSSRATSTRATAEGFAEEWDLDAALDRAQARSTRSSLDRRASSSDEAGGRDGLDRDEFLREELQRRRPRAPTTQREEELGAEVMRELERRVRALGARPQVARAPLRDGLPAGGHRPARDGPARPAGGVPARGLRHVRRR